MTLGSNATVGVVNNYQLTGVVSGAFSLTKVGAGQLSLNNAANTFSGGLIVNAGAIATASGDLAFGAANAPITLDGTGVILIVNQASQVTNTHPITLTANTTATLNIAQNQKWLFSNNTAFNGPSTATITRSAQSGATVGNVMQVTTNNSGYSGAWVINGGVMEIQNPFALGNASATNTVTLNNTLTAATVNEIGAVSFPQNIILASTSLSNTLGADNAASAFTGSITANSAFSARLGSFFNTTGQNLTFSGPLSGSGVMTIIPSAGGSLTGQVLTLSGNNSGYTPAISIPAGAVVAAAHPNALGTTANGTTIAPLAALDVQAAITGEPITLTAGAQTGIGSTGAIRNSSAANGSLDSAISLTGTTTPSFGVSGSGNLTLSGPVTGAVALTKVGTGSVRLDPHQPRQHVQLVRRPGGQRPGGRRRVPRRRDGHGRRHDRGQRCRPVPQRPVHAGQQRHRRHRQQRDGHPRRGERDRDDFHVRRDGDAEQERRRRLGHRRGDRVIHQRPRHRGRASA